MHLTAEAHLAVNNKSFFDVIKVREVKVVEFKDNISARITKTGM